MASATANNGTFRPSPWSAPLPVAGGFGAATAVDVATWLGPVKATLNAATIPCAVQGEGLAIFITLSVFGKP